MSLDSRVAAVTGASRGIGRGIAIALAARDMAKLNDVAAEIAVAGGMSRIPLKGG